MDNPEVVPIRQPSIIGIPASTGLAAPTLRFRPRSR